ncbi:hypothetical protein LXJ58_33455, partial [Escherichia coli]|nr:hypothetical protein [Escherichia coli]
PSLFVAVMILAGIAAIMARAGLERQRGGVGGMVQILEESWILIIVILAAVLTTGLVLTVKKLERDDKRWPRKGPDK